MLPKIALSLLFLVCFIAASAVTWTVNLYDTWGDGWNWATLTLMVNSGVVLNQITFHYGSGPATFNFSVVQGDQITTLFEPGGYPQECYYEIYNHNEELVRTVWHDSILEPLLAECLVVESFQIMANSNDGVLPINPAYSYTYSQSVFLNSELPVTSGMTRITKLRFAWNGNSAAPYSADWTVYLGNTARSNFMSSHDWEPLSHLVLVFNGNVVIPAVGGWVDITLDRPFIYNGGYNLLLAVDENTFGFDGAGRFTSSNVGGTPRSIVYYSNANNPNPASPPAASMLYTGFPNIIIQFDPYIHLPHQEDFNPCNDPYYGLPRFWTQSYTENLSNIWDLSISSWCGGDPYEACAEDLTPFAGTYRLISPPIRTVGLYSLQCTFNHLFYNPADPNNPGNPESLLTAKLQYSHDMETWYDSGWSLPGGQDEFDPETVTVTINGLSSPFTYLAWTLISSGYGYLNWYIDDVSLSAAYFDVAVISMDNGQAVAPASFSPQATVKNMGNETQTFIVNCSVPGFYSSMQSVASLPPGSTVQVTFDPFTPTLNSNYAISFTTVFGSDCNPDNNTLWDVLACVHLDTQAYAYSYVHARLVSFNLQNPDGMGLFGPIHSESLAASDWIDDAWHAVQRDEGSLTNHHFWRIDHLTGAKTLLGETGVALWGLAFDAHGNNLYASDLTSLYTLNHENGQASPVGTFGAGIGTMAGLAYDNENRVLYGIGGIPRKLYSIDPHTGAVSLIGPLGLDPETGFFCCTFDQDNGYIFAAIDTGNTSMLYWIDTASGTARRVGSFPSASFITGLAIPYVWTVPRVRISPPCTLSWDAIPGASLYLIYTSSDPYATEFTPLSYTSGTTWHDTSTTEMKRFYRVTAILARQSENTLLLPDQISLPASPTDLEKPPDPIPLRKTSGMRN